MQHHPNPAHWKGVNVDDPAGSGDLGGEDGEGGTGGEEGEDGEDDTYLLWIELSEVLRVHLLEVVFELVCLEGR
jgi:hypothetical protein